MIVQTLMVPRRVIPIDFPIDSLALSLAPPQDSPVMHLIIQMDSSGIWNRHPCLFPRLKLMCMNSTAMLISD